MLMCFVNWSSVISLNLLWKQVFSYIIEKMPKKFYNIQSKCRWLKSMLLWPSINFCKVSFPGINKTTYEFLTMSYYVTGAFYYKTTMAVIKSLS